MVGVTIGLLTAGIYGVALGSILGAAVGFYILLTAFGDSADFTPGFIPFIGYFLGMGGWVVIERLFFS